MRDVFRRRRALLRGVALGAVLVATAARAQPESGAASQIDLGTVLANGGQGGAGAGGAGAAPSATGTLKQAQRLKKLAPNVISVLPQSQIRKNPDVNIADALARLPGVSLVSDSGEGQFIDIRGLDADLNGTLFDGVHLTANDQGSPSGNERAPDLAVFPSGIVGGVEVVKSLTPDMDAEGLGGSANILPIEMPQGGGTMANVTLAAGAETLRPTGIFQGDLQLGTHFAIPGLDDFPNAKPFTAIFAYTYYSDRRGIDDFEEAYDPDTITAGGNQADLDNLQYRYYQEHRVRQGEYGELDFDPSPQTGFFARVLRSGYSNVIDKDRLEFTDTDAPNASGPNGAVGSDGDFTGLDGVGSQARYTYSQYSVTTNVVELGGHSVVADAVDLDGRLSWTQGSNVEPTDFVAEFKGPKVNGFNYSVTSPQYRPYAIDGGADAANPELYDLQAGGLTNNPQNALDQEWAAALDAAVPNNVAGGLGVAKFGGEIRLRSEGDLQSNFTNPDDGPNLAAVDAGSSEFHYYNGHFTLPPFPNYGLVLGQTPLVGATSNPEDPNDPTGAAYGDYQADMSAFQHNTENVYAGYGQETIQFGKIEALAGLRTEATNGTYRAYAAEDTGTQSAENGDEIISYTPNRNEQDYIDVFPSAQFKYAFTDQLQARATYSTGIARPGFQQISAATSTVIGGGTCSGCNAETIGNPDLKPTTGNSFDLTTEYYGPHDTTFSGGLFYKSFKNYIFTTITDTSAFYLGVPTPTQVTSYRNLGGAFARGLELDAHQRLYMLPAPIDGLGIDGNITFVDSGGRADGTQYKAYQLPETSPITYNAMLFYEKGPLYMDVSVNYVSRCLFAVVNPAASGFADPNPRAADHFTSARTTVDANISYAATPRVTFFAQARNLTNTPLEFTQSASSQYPIQREYYDLDYLGGVTVKLGS